MLVMWERENNVLSTLAWASFAVPVNTGNVHILIITMLDKDV